MRFDKGFSKPFPLAFVKFPSMGMRPEVVWFFMGSALPPLVAVALGPLVLRKAGLEGYAVLGLMTYFLNLAASYSDFTASTHLIATYAKRDVRRHSDLGNAVALKTLAWGGFLAGVALCSRYLPRRDGLYGLLAISMVAIALPSANLEWFFIAQRRYRELFYTRIVTVGFQVLLTVGWFFSPWKSLLFVPLIALCSGTAGSVSLLRLLGARKIRNGLAYLKFASWRGVGSLVIRLFPAAAVFLVAPYYLAYALPWYSLLCPDKKLVGAFSIGYRLVMGISALMVPAVLYMLARADAQSKRPSLRRALGLSGFFCAAFWVAGAAVVRFYFLVSRVEPGLFPHAFRVFSILIVGVFFGCLRVPYVAKVIAAGRYREYFIVHAVSCAPVLALSWIGGKRVPAEWVAWLACVPDFLTATVFILRERLAGARVSGRTGP